MQQVDTSRHGHQDNHGRVQAEQSFFRRHLAPVLLFSLVGFHLVNNYIVIANNNAHLIHSVIDLLIRRLGMSALFASAFESGALGVKQILMANAFFLVILILSVYGIGRELHSKKAGLLAAFIVGTFPHVFGLSRYFGSRFVLLAVTAAAIFFLLKTERFDDRRYSICLGITLYVCFFVRSEFLLFMAAPLLVHIYSSTVRRYGIKNLKRAGPNVKNLFIALASFLVLALARALYFPTVNRSGNVRELLISLTVNRGVEPVSLFDLFYLKILVGFQVLHYYGVLLLILLPLFLRRRGRHRVLILSWYVFPFLFFTIALYNNKLPSFILAALPAVALIIAIGLMSIKWAELRTFLVALTVVVGLTQYLVLTYSPKSYPFIDRLNTRLKLTVERSSCQFFRYAPRYGVHPWSTKYAGFLHAYPSDWGVGEVTGMIGDSWEDKDEPGLILCCDKALNHIFSSALSYTLYLEGIRDFEFVNLCGGKLSSMMGEKYASLVNRFPSHSKEGLKETEEGRDELLDRSSYLLFTDVPAEDEEPRELIRRGSARYTLLGSVLTPNDITMYVYKNEP